MIQLLQRGDLSALGHIALLLPTELHRGALESARHAASELARSAPRKSGRLARFFEVRVLGARHVAASSTLPYARILDRGGTIRPRSRSFLRVPLSGLSAVRAKGLRFIPRDGRNPLLAVVSRNQFDPRFVLVRQVSIRGRGYVETAASRARPQLERDAVMPSSAPSGKESVDEHQEANPRRRACSAPAHWSSGGLHTDVRIVERGLKTWDEAKPGEMPWLGYAAIGERFDPQPNRMYRVSLRIKVIGHVNETDPSARELALDQLTDDVIAALHADVTRDRNAITTLAEESATDEADPFVRAHGTLEMTFVVAYLRGIGVTP